MKNQSRASRVVPCGQTDGRADMTKLMVVFRNSGNAHNNDTALNIFPPYNST